VTWSKENGVLPASSYQDNVRGVLVITSIRSSDSGTYVCSATDGFYINTDKAVISIQDQPPDPEAPWQVVQVSPTDADVQSGDEVRISCYCPTPGFTLTWSKLNDRLPPQAYQQAGTLVIPAVSEPHAGIYECTARNGQGRTLTAETRITVRAKYQPPPTVRVEPEQITLIQGREGRLACIADGQPAPAIEWSKVGEDLRNSRNIYVQGSILQNFIGAVNCSATFQSKNVFSNFRT
jgi:hypothetical protein